MFSILLRLSVVMCVIYFVYAWTTQPNTIIKRKQDVSHFSAIFPYLQDSKEFTNDERRIARHFAIDTLPGLMQKGLIKKYKRYETVTLLLVTGKIWKERSRFFKESLLTEVLVYNKVHGYALETQVVDHRSQRLYAQASSSDKKEFFD
jgi:hypothetical protein